MTDSSESSDGEAKRSVVFVSQQFPPDRSGHASRIDHVATSLADDGWAVTVLAPPASFPPEDFGRSWRFRESTTVDGVVVNRLWAWQPTTADPGFLARMAYYVLFAAHSFLWLLCNGRQYDVVVTTTPPISTGVAGLTTELFGQRWVVDVRDLWIDASISLGFIEEGGALERVSRRYQRFVLGRADSIAVTTETLGDRLCDQYGEHLSTKIRLVPNGVDIARFANEMDGTDASEAGEVETDDDVTDSPATDDAETDDPYVVIYTGNIGHAQDLGICVDALASLPESVQLRLVGGGDAVADLKRRATEQGVRDRVEFVDPVPHEQIPDLLSDAHVGVAPLKDDDELSYAMPTKVYEYLGCALPVVATGNGELDRFLEESGGGILAENDPESVAASIERLQTDPDLRAETGRRGHEYVRDRYDRNAIADRFESHLRNLSDGDHD
ncbi:glycosyltransferase family 4 protein [Halovenus marina]|uniref:glycosyltransferase family 4 protein n=1 Tax=Halovenus marina TaxID=3396621 RepID=UPI003F57D296